MIDKNALLSIGGFIQDEITPYVDYPTFLELSLRGRFYPSDKVMGYWRKHKAQITTEKESDMNQAFMVSVDFYEKLSKTLQKSIEFKMDDKLEFQDNIIKDQIAVSARLALIKGNWKEASRNYKNIIKNSTLKIKIQSILGIICAYLRITLEWFAVLTCKPKIRDVGGEWDSTLFKNENNKTFMFKIQFAILKILIFIKPSKYPDSKDLIVNELEI
jgi:hypothetical protein